CPNCNAAVPCCFRLTLIVANKCCTTNSRCAQMREPSSSYYRSLVARTRNSYGRLVYTGQGNEDHFVAHSLSKKPLFSSPSRERPSIRSCGLIVFARAS